MQAQFRMTVHVSLTKAALPRPVYVCVCVLDCSIMWQRLAAERGGELSSVIHSSRSSPGYTEQLLEHIFICLFATDLFPQLLPYSSVSSTVLGTF